MMKPLADLILWGTVYKYYHMLSLALSLSVFLQLMLNNGNLDIFC